MAEDKNLIQIQKGVKAYGARALFADATFSVNEKEHIGVIGPNGAGKSTLFKILIGEENLNEGLVVKSRDLRLGYLSQHDLWQAGETGNAYLERTSVLPIWETKSLGRSLQLSEEILERPITSLSGGYRMRLKLMGLLGQNPNLMLLDEPTNYLDLETTLLVENFLQSFDGAFLLISHDREFLRRTTDHILEIEQGEVTKYNGNIDDYFEQKELLRSQLEAKAQNLAEKRKTILEFVARFGAKATKARQAQSRLKSLEKMETIELKPLPVAAQIRIPAPPHVGKRVIRMEGVDLGYGEMTVLSNIQLEILRGDHVAVVGLNGAGKSTLLKGLAGSISPQSGRIELGHQVDLAIYNQHVIEVLDSNKSVLESLEAAAHPDVSLQEIKDLAGSLLFSGDDVQKKVKVLSGGEKSRVALGQILLKKVPFLLLDEPTNHLDFQTVEALIQSLSEYQGTVVVVSHDRSFVRRVGSKILEVSRGEVHLYPGTYDEYVWSLQNRLANLEEEKPRNPASFKSESKKSKDWAEKKDLEKRLRKIDKEIESAESRIESLEKLNFELNHQISEGQIEEDKVQKLSENSRELEELERKWSELGEEKTRIEKQLSEFK